MSDLETKLNANNLTANSATSLADANDTQRMKSTHFVLWLCRYCHEPLFDKAEAGPDPDIIEHQMHRECINKNWT